MVPLQLTAAFTRKELLIVLVVLVVCALGAAFALPYFARAKVGGGPLCSSNQKQIALAFRMWANDHQDRFPMQVTVAEGGIKGFALQGRAVAVFVSLSNELGNPKVLRCPQDLARSRATDFAQVAIRNLSYFVSLDASVTNLASILLGDRNVCINGQSRTGLVEITNSGTVTWGPGIHVGRGNVALADGSSSPTTDPLLQKALQDSGVATNRFIIP